MNPLPLELQKNADAAPACQAAPPPVPKRPLTLSPEMLAEPTAGRGLDFERGMSRFPPLTMGLLVFLALIFACEMVLGALDNQQAMLAAGALEREAVLRGEVWRILWSMNLHASWGHLVGNAIGLFMLGLAVEHAFGMGSALVLYLVAGIAAAACSLVFEGGPTVGASGAIFGWWGAAVVFFYRYRRRLMERDGRVGFVLLVWAGWTVFSGLTTPEISNSSHLGGFVAGALMALVLAPRLPELDKPAVARYP